MSNNILKINKKKIEKYFQNCEIWWRREEGIDVISYVFCCLFRPSFKKNTNRINRTKFD